MGGLPLYNLPQVSAWYPLYLLPFDLYATPTATMSTLHAITLLHLALFTGNAWLLMRTLRMEPVAAFFGTLFVVFNTATLGVMNWANLFASYSWLPLYLAGAVRLLECRRGFRGTALTCVGLAMLAYAMVGQPLVMAAALTIILLSAYAASRWQAGDRLGAAEGPARLTMALVAAACLTAPVVLPVLCDLGSMIRWVGPTTAIRANEQMPFECYVTDQMTSEELPSFVVPWHATHVHAIAQPYVGAFPLLLAALGLACSPARHWLARPLVIVAVYSFLSCFGDTFGLARINYHVPILNKVRESTYFLLPLNLAVGILAGWGVEWLWTTLRDTRVGGRWPVQRLTAGAILAAACAAQVAGVRWHSPTVRDSDYLRSDLVKLESAFERVKHLDPNGEYRVVFGNGINAQTAAMLASYYGLRTLTCYVNPLPFDQFNDIYYHGPRPDNYPQVLGAKYLICREGDPVTVPGYEPRIQVSGYEIRENEQALPRTFVTSNVVATHVPRDVAIRILADHDLRTLPLVVTEADGDRPQPSSGTTGVQATWKPDLERLNERRYVVSCDQPAVFVLNEYHGDAWQTRMDGIYVPALKVNASQIGVSVSPGSHVVEFLYRPRVVLYGQALAVAGVVFAMVLILVGRHGRLQPRGEPAVPSAGRTTFP
jgi:hypothetical protein